MVLLDPDNSWQEGTYQAGAPMDFENIILTKEVPAVTIQLNRPEVLNALSHRFLTELAADLERFDADAENRDDHRFEILRGRLTREKAVPKADELALRDGLEFERRNFFVLFSSPVQKEGMRAFMEKRMPQWKGK